MNAIILAAGMGTRLRPLTYDTPKSLVKVNGQPLVERQIEALKEVGINEIIIATGYLSEKFNYLKEKYGVKLIFNDKYDVYNNGYTMYLLREYLGNSLVLEGDVYIANNFLRADLKESTYFGGEKKDFLNEWMLEYNENNEIIDIVIESGSGYIMTGVSYWTIEDGKRLKAMLEAMIADNELEDVFWDDLVKDNLKDFNIKIHKVNSDDWVEIDSVKDLQEAENIQGKNTI